VSQESRPDTFKLALERTHLAAQRTFFSVLRTGLAIAGAGTVFVNIALQGWPEWVSYLLAGAFIAVGYTMIIVALNRYQKVINKLRVEHDMNVMSPHWMIALTVALQIVLAVVLIMFMLSLITVVLPTAGE
jgi:uncharacterized membrane protein YidH (DUF202 family)